VGNLGDSFPCWKVDLIREEISWTNFFAVVFQRQQRDLPPDDEPDPSGVLLLCNMLPLLFLVFSEILPLTFSALQVSPLFRPDV